MQISPARQAAYSILHRVESGHDFAVELLQASDVSNLKIADRALATEIVMGVLRWRGELDYHIAQLTGTKWKGFESEVLTILRMGIYQIRFLERVPKSAVVNDAVELAKVERKRSAAGLVNAVLRRSEPPLARLQRREFDSLSADERQSVRRAFPEWLLDRWQSMGSTNAGDARLTAPKLAYASLQTPRTILRLDARADGEAVRGELQAANVRVAPCRFAARGVAVEAGSVQDLPAWREGRVVIQDEGSQLVGEIVSPEPGQRVLDLCAAPGIKAGQIAQNLGAGVYLACDRSAARLRTMAKLLPKWVPETVNLALVRLDAARPLPFGAKFHRILVDALCSGTGTLARNPEIKWRLVPGDIPRLAELQTRMLSHALPALAERGRLVYATCSLEPEENEGVVEKVLRAHPEFRRLTRQELTEMHPRLEPLIDAQGYMRTRPDLHAIDGFTAAVIVHK